jgi:hypothetical protein
MLYLGRSVNQFRPFNVCLLVCCGFGEDAGHLRANAVVSIAQPCLGLS